MTQVVIIEDEYDVWSYPEDANVLKFKLRRYRDEFPDKYQLKALRGMIDKVTIPEAREWLERWYAENSIFEDE